MKHNILLIVFLLNLVGCSSLLYHPTRMMYYPPEQNKISYENIFIEVEENIKIHAWHLKSTTQPPRGVILFFHGNAENISSHYAALAWILKEKYDVVAWDYRSYGLSQGEPTPKNTVQDGMKVIEHVHAKFKDKPLFIFAQSLGGVVAMRSVIELKKDPTKQIPIKALIVDSTFQSYQSVSRSILSKHWLTWLFQPLAYVLMSDKWAPEDRIHEIAPIPFLVMHGTKDAIINFDYGKEVFEDAKDPKTFWAIENGMHIDSFWRHDFVYRKKFLEYLDSILKK